MIRFAADVTGTVTHAAGPPPGPAPHRGGNLGCCFVLVVIAGALLGVSIKLFEASLGHLRAAREAAARAEAGVEALGFRLEHVQYAVEDAARAAAERQDRMERSLRGDLPPRVKLVEDPGED